MSKKINPEYNKNIDYQFSFSNEVYPSKFELVNKIKNMSCDGNIMLEPRLQEYMRKKKIYKQNGVNTVITLEQEYQITDRDKKIIREFIRGRRDIYTNKKFDKFNKSTNTKKQFPSKEFRDIINENQPQMPITNKPINRGMFFPDDDEEYYIHDMKPIDIIKDSRDFVKKDTDNIVLDNTKTVSTLSMFDEMENIPIPKNKCSNSNMSGNNVGWNPNESRFRPRNDPQIDQGIADRNKFASQYRVDPDPRNKNIISNLMTKNAELMDSTTTQLWSDYNGQYNFPNNHHNLLNNNINQVLDGNERYGEINMSSYSTTSNIDPNNKKFIPHMACKSKKELNTSAYKTMPYIGNDANKMNAEIETQLIRGMPSSFNKAKSYGYRDISEHSFDYIDPSFQSADNAVLPFPMGGMGTRQFDKEVAKKSRERYT